ncbi:MAG TPA: class I SAM-dependent methyltransferase [Luteimonas sp.]|nr:class I SAM-dependent methyltransferase [Luteimonas sp.]
MNICPACAARHSADDFRCPACGFDPPCVRGIPLLAPALAAAVSGFDAAEFQALAAGEAGHFWFEGRNAIILDRFRRFFRPARDYLEVGCGTGFVLAAIARTFPDMAVTASEVLADGLAHAAPRAPRARLLQLDARALPFEAAFDVIGAFDVLEHIAEDALVLSQMHRALRPGGGVLLAVPQHPWLWSAQDEIARHVRRYRRDELEHKLRTAGFEVLHSTSFMTLLLPLLWLSRTRRAAARGAGDARAAADAELAPPAWINAICAAALAAERVAIRGGLRLPLGGSRLVVARRLEPA